MLVYLGYARANCLQENRGAGEFRPSARYLFPADIEGNERRLYDAFEKRWGLDAAKVLELNDFDYGYDAW
jgi:hypothetical protein